MGEGPGSTTCFEQSRVVMGPMVPPEPPVCVLIPLVPPLVATAGESPAPPMRLPVHAGWASRAANPASGTKVPRSLDLLTNDVVFPA
jgi:hypothetical protein